jgi:hypothetical protein
VRFMSSSMSTPSDDRRVAIRMLGTGNIAGRWGSNSGRRSLARSTRRLGWKLQVTGIQGRYDRLTRRQRCGYFCQVGILAH